jgi:hypothetical protein
VKLMHGYLDRGHGHGTHAICAEDGTPLEMTAENVERIVNLWNFADVSKEELAERNRILSDIALSAVALKLNIEHGFPPHLHALERDLAAFSARFGGAIVKSGAAK